MALGVEYTTGEVEIHRVPFTLSQTHALNPQAAQGIMTNEYEFPALAALDNGNLVIGKDTLTQDITFPLKTIFLYCAGITRPETLDALPGCLLSFFSSIDAD